MKDYYDHLKAELAKLRQFTPANLEAPSLEMAEWLVKEIDRLRLIENACEPVISEPIVSAKSVLELRHVMRTNPRPRAG